MARLADGRASLTSIVRLIEQSPVVVGDPLPRAAEPHCRLFDLPPGYEATDVFVLEWIAAETMRRRRDYLPL
jgi:hypothetical protein